MSWCHIGQRSMLSCLHVRIFYGVWHMCCQQHLFYYLKFCLIFNWEIQVEHWFTCEFDWSDFYQIICSVKRCCHGNYPLMSWCHIGQRSMLSCLHVRIFYGVWHMCCQQHLFLYLKFCLIFNWEIQVKHWFTCELDWSGFYQIICLLSKEALPW